MSKKGVIFFKILISEIFWIFFDFILIFIDFNSFKKGKKLVIFPQESQADVAWDPRGCIMARKATWQRHADPREPLCGAEVAWTRSRATRVHADARVAPTRHDGLRAGR